MGRFFNTAGPCRPEWHYMVPAAERLSEVPWLVDKLGYFVVHAPRQTGKTTALRAIASELTASGGYAALAFSCEGGRAAGDDYEATQRAVLDEIRISASAALPGELQPPQWPQVSSASLLRAGLAAWATVCPRPLVLFFDEIDALSGASLYSVLGQLRADYDARPDAFPASVGLCGLRDVRDYKAASGGDSSRLLSASPFNIKLKSLRLGDFSVEEVATLYGQHVAETGQVFTDAGVEFAFELTRGQPWLVNALANEVVAEMGVPSEEAIGPRRLEVAKERLIRARATHLDSLAAKLVEPRVRRVVEPLITGEDDGAEARQSLDDTYDDDASYLRDLGLVSQGRPLRVANPIYREVIPRVLGGRVEDRVTQDPRSFVRDDGRFDFRLLLTEFVSFWKQHGEVLTEREAYHEAAPQLVLMAFLHRIVNGGGFIDREYGVGRGRIDLCVRWPFQDAVGKRVFQREAMELKVWRDNRADPLAEGLGQLDDYLDRLELGTGVLVIFDRRAGAKPLCERVVFDTAQTPADREVTVLRL